MFRRRPQRVSPPSAPRVLGEPRSRLAQARRPNDRGFAGFAQFQRLSLLRAAGAEASSLIARKGIGDVRDTEGIGLSEAITKLRAELISARDAGRDDEIQFPVVHAQAGGTIGAGNEQTQTVTVVFGAPLDRHGRPAKIARPGPDVLD